MSEKVMTELPDVIMKEITRWAEEEGIDKSVLLILKSKVVSCIR